MTIQHYLEFKFEIFICLQYKKIYLFYVLRNKVIYHRIIIIIIRQDPFNVKVIKMYFVASKVCFLNL